MPRSWPRGSGVRERDAAKSRALSHCSLCIVVHDEDIIVSKFPPVLERVPNKRQNFSQNQPVPREFWIHNDGINTHMTSPFEKGVRRGTFQLLQFKKVPKKPNCKLILGRTRVRVGPSLPRKVGHRRGLSSLKQTSRTVAEALRAPGTKLTRELV